MKAIRFLFLGLALIGLFGCSLQSVNLKPQMNTANLKAAKAGSIIAEKEFKFQGCALSADQKDLVLSVQSKIAGLYDKLLMGKISIKTYNQKVATADDAINKVVRACSSASKASSAAKKDKQAIAKSTMNLKTAWQNLKQVNQNL
jgi:hypothetical protein